MAEAVARLAEQGLPVSADTLRRWAAAGRLRTIRTPGGQRRFLQEDIDTILTPEPEQVAS